ncbi:SixA phosphatase family protein [Ulvibacter antarcticus]|uniref:Histidine phosphatase superfamily protein (Branch 1) n=1 Tax=Ulvibacter antarcticus TaxID=442714 RepID=A0A3L9YX07_9FLAO|nr:phosphoglycerate mutase family protein [Ulvibacter antarcticus]RMA64874.1 histidine phosphatase superfamily protein (branch 1) [Ulvibacter antarcticus]
MQKILLSALIVLLFSSCKENKKEIATSTVNEVSTTYYLIRHAEKDRSDSTNQNPELNAQGIERAQNWAAYFEDKKIDQIYATDYKRTMQTAAYTAASKNLMIQSYDPSNLYTDDFKTETKGHDVLIVGHSNTTPQFVNAIIGEKKYPDIDDSENGMLFMVTVTGNDKNVQIFTVD